MNDNFLFYFYLLKWIMLKDILRELFFTHNPTLTTAFAFLHVSLRTVYTAATGWTRIHSWPWWTSVRETYRTKKKKRCQFRMGPVQDHSQQEATRIHKKFPISARVSFSILTNSLPKPWPSIKGWKWIWLYVTIYSVAKRTRINKRKRYKILFN